MPSFVALVMTVYNREDYLSQALDSILAQTYPHWNLTIWDDGSTDSSPEIGQLYAQLDPRICFIQGTHAGQTPSLREAIMTIDPHPYLGWVDSDDLLAPDALAMTVRILDNRAQIGMVYTNHRSIDGSNRDLGLGARCQIPYSPERLLIDFMTFQFRLLRREIYDRVGGIDLEFIQAQDYDICLKIAEVTEIFHCPQSLYAYRVHPTMISQLQRTDVTTCSAKAVRNALVRRGLSDRYCLHVTTDGRFKISNIRAAAIPNSNEGEGD
jgi:glycosyltransferase involved in cell wall biosynthesis